MKTKQFLFLNLNNNTQVKVEAIDGFNAWKEFYQVTGAERIARPSPWELFNVCHCGNFQAERFCSKECFELN